MKRRIALFLLVLTCIGSTKGAAAHPADQHQSYHAVALSSDGVQVAWRIAVGPLLARGLWQQADADGDSLVTSVEASAWAVGAASLLQGRLDDTAQLAWHVDSVSWPVSFEAMQAGSEAIQLELSATWPGALSGEHRLVLANQWEPKHSASWFAVQPVHTIEVSAATVEQQAQFAIRFHPLSPNDELIPSQSGLSAGEGTLTPPAAAGSGTLRRLTELLQTQSTTPAFYGAALAIALALGALHALTPGHGKTVVAAYLVGSRGTNLHAVGLGAVTTLTHTGSVLVLGAIVLVASRTIVPNDLFPWLEVASGALIILLGANLLYRRWFEYRRFRHRSGHHPSHDHPHSHDHDDGHDHGHTHLPEPGRVTWRSLLFLGVSGGIVPCPDAIAILLLAIVIQRIGLGLALIVSFSLGLAVVLIAIGLVMLHSRRLFARLSMFDRVSPALPVVSAAIVLFLGVALTARAL